MTSGITLEVKEEHGIAIVHVGGRLDAATAPVLEKKIANYLTAKKKRVLLDFTKVDYLSSAGMRLLLSVSKQLKANGGALAICSMTDDVMEIIKMAGFEKVLKIFADEDEAVAALKVN